MKTTIEEVTTGFCSICQTVHLTVSPNFDRNRICENCGEEAVYSLAEYSDVMNDYEKLKEDYKVLANTLQGDGVEWI